LATEITITIVEKLVSLLPSFISRKHYSQKRLDEAIDIEARTANPVWAGLSGYVPDIRACFTIRNFTDLTWRVHDFSAELWVGQPLAVVTCYDRPDIAGRRKGEIFTRCFLNERQVARLEEERRKGAVKATFYVYAYLESKIGLRKFCRTIENCPVSF